MSAHHWPCHLGVDLEFFLQQGSVGVSVWRGDVFGGKTKWVWTSDSCTYSFYLFICF